MILAAVLGWGGWVDAAGRVKYPRDVEPVLAEFCWDCHADGMKRGGVAFDGFKSHPDRVANLNLWLAVARNLESGLMPPARKPQPTPQQRAAVEAWIEQEVFRLDPRRPDPGRVTLRRLNREEYRYSVRDLLGVEFNASEAFPADDTGFGFDTVGDALNVSPLLLEKYVDAAQTIAAAAASGAPGQDPFLRGLPELPAARKSFVRERLRRVVDRAFRRPVDAPTLDRLTDLALRGAPESPAEVEAGVVQALAAILASPRFLFRAELQPHPEDPKEVVPLDDWALAARLSYFLWSSLPDEELFGLAREKRLRAALPAQVDRLLADPRSRRFVEGFVGQWLRTRDVEAVPLDAERLLGLSSSEDALKVFNPQLRQAMRWETERMFEHLLQEKRDVRELLTADYTFLNETLARFYGVEGVSGPELRKVHLPTGSHRGGLLTHGSLLLVTSNPTRTSPVKRGLFILENLLGTPPPPPPVNVPPLEAAASGSRPVTVREMMRVHREDPLCHSCHARMDPLGLALENYDALGRYRATELGEPIDSTGALITGEGFRDVPELARVLAGQRRADLHRCVVEKLLTYALGRGLEYYDRPLVRELTGVLDREGGRLTALIHGIVESPAFQQRRGNGERLQASASGRTAAR